MSEKYSCTIRSQAVTEITEKYQPEVEATHAKINRKLINSRVG